MRGRRNPAVFLYAGVNHARHQAKTADGQAQGFRGEPRAEDAGSILKEQYEAQQNQRKPAERSPVQYATDKVETTARRGTALAVTVRARRKAA
jgi:hypothetical protein